MSIGQQAKRHKASNNALRQCMSWSGLDFMDGRSMINFATVSQQMLALVNKRNRKVFSGWRCGVPSHDSKKCDTAVIPPIICRLCYLWFDKLCISRRVDDEELHICGRSNA